MENLNLVVRKTEFKDLERIKFLYDTAFDSETEFSKMQSKFLELETNKDNIYISAIYDNVCVGFGQLVIHHDITETTQPFSTFWCFVVDETLQGKGIGTEIMKFAEDESKKRNCAFMKLTTNETRKGCVKVCEKRNYRKSICYTKDFSY